MRAVKFTVDEEVHALIEQEAEALGTNVAHFCRMAATGRALLWAYRRGYQLADPEAWQPIFDQLEKLERHDIKLRAKHARDRRLAGSSRKSREPTT